MFLDLIVHPCVDLICGRRSKTLGRLSKLASVTLPVAQCQTDSRASLCAGYSQSAGWGEGRIRPAQTWCVGYEAPWPWSAV